MAVDGVDWGGLGVVRQCGDFIPVPASTIGLRWC